MQIKNKPITAWASPCMWFIGTVATGAAVLLRVLLTPSLRDVDTGRFSANIPAMALMLIALLVLAVFSLLVPKGRTDLTEHQALPTTLAGLLAGALLGISCVWDVFRWFMNGVTPPPAHAQDNTFALIVLFFMLGFGILGAVALIRWSWRVTAQGGTHRGMSAWGALAPVLWAWFRLARYEMSFTSTVGWSQRFYDFFLVIFEVLFLFKLARFVSGIGKATTGEMLFYAMGTVMFTLSGTLTRVCLYFSSDSEAYAAGGLAGVADFGIGLFALVFAWSLMRASRGARANVPQEDFSEDDIPYDPSLESSFVLDDVEAAAENEGYKEP